MKRIEYVFRMTHIDNIPYIAECGFAHKDSVKASADYIPIGDMSMIDARSRKIVVDGYSLDEFIPFYFGPRSPMLYEIQHGFNNVKKRGADEIVYCVVRLDTIREAKQRFYFTDGHAMNAITSFYGMNRIGEIDSIISCDDVFAQYWKNDDPDLKRRKEAELLLLDELPPEMIAGYVVYDEGAKNKLLQAGIAENRICINKNYYF